MIKGYATTRGTSTYAARHAQTAFGALGRTGLTACRAGFGGYRVSTGAAHHEAALRTALGSGINLIDTSANYADGGSESLVGEVLTDMTARGEVEREKVIVVSKVGYLQGENFALSRRRKEEGRPFPDLVEYGQGLEHCIHPVFIEDQLTRSLSRLKLETLDGYLLHNPEYYLGWSKKSGVPPEQARAEYERRIRAAFEHLETEVENGRIRWYGISSNTFPNAQDDPQFTCLETVWEIARSVSADHHFALVQMPFNLLETGAVLEANQPSGKSALFFAEEKNLGVLINRPLNAFAGGKLFRLSDMNQSEPMDPSAVISTIRALGKSETRLWKTILPGLEIPQGLKARVKQQNEVANSLEHYWRNFGSYEGFRQAKTGVFWPRVQGVLDFLGPRASENEDLAHWLDAHRQCLQAAFDAVGSVYAHEAEKVLNRIRRAVNDADSDWGSAETLSQKAVRALRTTAGVSTVLVGMRRKEYVADVLAELQRPGEQSDRGSSWEALGKSISDAI